MPRSKMALTPSKDPEPAARLANSLMPQHPARLQMVARVVGAEFSRAEGLTSQPGIHTLSQKAGQTILALTPQTNI